MDVTSVKRIHQSDWTNHGVRFLRARDIVASSKNEVPSDHLYISEEKYKEYTNISGKVKPGDLLVTGVGSIGVPMLVVDDTPVYFKDGNIIWFKNENKIDGNFFYYSFTNTSIQKFIRDVAGIGTVGTYTIQSGKKTPILLPNFEEQQKIGAFFKFLDDTIALHQDAIQRQQDLKKAMLQKLFPVNGSTIPDVRFASFSEEWEQRKFSKIVNRVSKSSDEQNLPRVEYEDIVSGEGVLNKGIFEKSSEKKGTEFLPGDTLYGKLRPYLKNWLYADFKGIAVGDFWVLRPLNSNDEFVYSLIQSDKYQLIANQSSGTKMPRSDWSTVSNTAFFIPKNMDEQKKIGEFFKALENSIDLHQQALEKLKLLKKSLLQKMFI